MALCLSGELIANSKTNNKKREPIAVCVTPAIQPARQITTQFVGMNTVFWVHKGSAYMLISKKPQQKLDNMAESLLAQQCT